MISIDKKLDGRHYGSGECIVCKNPFNWVEDENASTEVNEVSMDGNKCYLTVKVVYRCPSCNYNCSETTKLLKE